MGKEKLPKRLTRGHTVRKREGFKPRTLQPQLHLGSRRNSESFLALRLTSLKGIHADSCSAHGVFPTLWLLVLLAKTVITLELLFTVLDFGGFLSLAVLARGGFGKGVEQVPSLQVGIVKHLFWSPGMNNAEGSLHRIMDSRIPALLRQEVGTGGSALAPPVDLGVAQQPSPLACFPVTGAPTRCPSWSPY